MHPKPFTAPPALSSRPAPVSQKPPAAPPVYRPQQANTPPPAAYRPHAAPVQRKAVSGAPPAYRPSLPAVPLQARSAPPVYHPQPLPVRNIQCKPATPGAGAPPVYKPSPVITRALPRPFPVATPSVAPPVFTARGMATLQAYFTHSGNELTAGELAAIRGQVIGKKKAFDKIAKDRATPNPISAWLKEQEITLTHNGKNVSVTQFLKAINVSMDVSDASDTEEGSSSEEEDNGIPLLHRGESLSGGLWEKQAYRHASDDIRNKEQVFDDLPDNIQADVHKMVKAAADPFMPKVKKTVTPNYIVSVAPLSHEKAGRSEPTGHPLGSSRATFRMVGTQKGGQFQEESGTSYANVSPAGYFNGTHTQKSHALPSMLLSPEHRASGGNTTVIKSTFTNQTYDRGSEDTIFQQFGQKSGRYVVAVEIMDVDENP